MVEVFTTNVDTQEQACMLLERIHTLYTSYRANFDLEDRDRILRVRCDKGDLCPQQLIDLLQRNGYCASVLPDDVGV